MKVICFVFCLFLGMACPLTAAGSEDAMVELDFSCLQEAYPGFFTRIERDEKGGILFMTVRGPLVYDDGQQRSPAEALEAGTLKDSLAQVYPLEPQRPDFGKDLSGGDPGRIRSYALLRLLYGSSQKEVEQRLVQHPFGTEKVRVASDVWTHLESLRAELLPLLEASPELKKYFTPFYSYFWRAIAGTKRLSPHSFGIALDMNPELGAYWRWSSLRPHPDQKTFPPQLVALFEKHGFIWGGKWAHYDLMHVEFRPELLIKAHRLAVPSTGQ